MKRNTALSLVTIGLTFISVNAYSGIKKHTTHHPHLIYHHSAYACGVIHPFHSSIHKLPVHRKPCLLVRHSISKMKKPSRRIPVFHRIEKNIIQAKPPIITATFIKPLMPKPICNKCCNGQRLFNCLQQFDFSLEALYLQPINNDLTYATFNQPGVIIGNATSITNQNVNPNYNWAFRLGLGYTVPTLGNDIEFYWTHFNHSTSAHAPTNGDIITRSGVQFSMSGIVSIAGQGNATFKYDALDLELGQRYFTYYSLLRSRLFFGVRTAELTSNMNNSFHRRSIIGNPYFDDETDVFNSKVYGIGPRLGGDFNYFLGRSGWNIAGHFAGTILLSRVESSSSLSRFGIQPSGIPETSNNTLVERSPNQTRLIPAFDTKLGLAYSMPVNQFRSTFNIEAGYQYTEYLNAVDRLNINVNQSTVLQSTNTTTSNLGFQGSYVTLSFKA